MRWKWWWSGVAILLVSCVILVIWSGAPRREGVAVLGDHAPAVRRALGDPAVVAPETAAVTVILVEDWSKLAYLGALGALAPASLAQEDWFVRILSLRASGSSKLLYFNLSRWMDTEKGLQTDCLRRVIEKEWSGLMQHGEEALCAADLPAPFSRIDLPMGMGSF